MQTIYIFLLLVLSTQLVSEEVSYFYLKRGPESIIGLPFLKSNIIPAIYGQYTNDEAIVDVYTLSFQPEFPELENSIMPCTTLTLEQYSSIDKQFYLFYSEIDKRFFLFVPKNLNDICSFVSIFYNRYSYFYNLYQNRVAFQFPAILEP